MPGPNPTPAAVPLVTTACIISFNWPTVLDGSGVAVTCLVPGSRIGCLNVPAATVAATDAIASGVAVSCPSPNASWASSEPLALAGALK